MNITNDRFGNCNRTFYCTTPNCNRPVTFYNLLLLCKNCLSKDDKDACCQEVKGCHDKITRDENKEKYGNGDLINQPGPSGPSGPSGPMEKEKINVKRVNSIKETLEKISIIRKDRKKKGLSDKQ